MEKPELVLNLFFKYRDKERKMRPINEASFLDLITESNEQYELVTPFRVGEIVRAMPNSPLFRFLSDYLDRNIKMKIKESYILDDSINYDYIVIPFTDRKDWISEQRMPVKHTDLILERGLRPTNHILDLTSLPAGVSFRFLEDVEGISDDEYVISEKEEDITIEGRKSGDKFVISKDGAKNYEVEILA